MKPASLARDVVEDVDRLLDVAARFPERLPHLARHLAGIFLLAAHQDLPHPEEIFGALRSGQQPPALVGAARGLDRRLDIGGDRVLEGSDDLASVGGTAVVERLPGGRLGPFSVDEIPVCPGLGHAGPRDSVNHWGAAESLLITV